MPISLSITWKHWEIPVQSYSQKEINENFAILKWIFLVLSLISGQKKKHGLVNVVYYYSIMNIG